MPSSAGSARRWRVLLCLGTRPEAVKLAPVYERLAASDDVEPVVAVTAQHRRMLDQTLATFGIVPDLDLRLMRPEQSLADLTGVAVAALGRAIEDYAPDAVLVQGDTTTAFSAALAAFYAGVPVGHVEAGLRTGDPLIPFPEEVNRRMVAVLARWHWAPTARNAAALVAEGIDAAAVEVTGNTVIDALLTVAARPLSPDRLAQIPPKRAEKRVLVTLHRRETQGDRQRDLCRALAEVARRPDTEVLFPVHASPAVRRTVMGELADAPGVHLTEPLDYHVFAHALRSADIVATDSGGLQEEAPALDVPVLLLRDKTERMEAVEAGTVRLVGTDGGAVRAALDELLDDDDARATMASAENPYGDGRAAARVVDGLLRGLGTMKGPRSVREAEARA